MGSPSQTETDTIVTETVGNRLKRERLNKHVTLEEIAEATRVNVATLQALENDEKSKLPARVFVQGFIRLYAKHVGLDPEEILAHFPKDADDTIDTKKRINVRKVLKSEAMAESPSFMSSKVILFLILILLLGFLIYLGRQNYFPELNSLKPATSNQTEQSKQTPAPKIEPQPAASLADSAPQEIEPVANTDEPVTVQPVAKQEYILKASFTERTWVWIQVDNNDPREYLFQTGEHFKWIAHDKIDINLGNAGGVNLVLNDKPIAQIGVSGQVVRLTMPGASQTILPSSTNAP